jgi:tetratricopeptide (TPR) repeat protein/S1-C subfamily serine protease
MNRMLVSGVVGISSLFAMAAVWEIPSNATLQRDNSSYPSSSTSQRLVSQSQNSIVSNVDRIAQQITIRIDSKLSGSGSGAIVARQGNTYTVLTAEHVVPKPDQYTVVTPDGQTHTVNLDTIQRFPGVDLAVLKFSSSQTYSVATLANYVIGLGDQPLAFLSGFPGGSGISTPPTRKLTAGTASPTAVAFLTTQSAYSVASGRELTYTSFSQPGMSGGPVLDQLGRVIGIHNASETRLEDDDESGDVIPVYLGRSLGIPIATFLGLAPRAQVDTSLLKVETTAPPAIAASQIQSTIAELMKEPPPGEKATAFDWLRYSNQLWRVRRYPEALSAVDRAIQLKPNFHQAHYVKGIILLTLNKSEEAIASFDKSIQLQPQFYEALRQKADALERLRQYSTAQSVLEQAIRIKPDDYTLHILRGDILTKLEQPEAAEGTYTKALTLKENYYYTHFRRAQVRFQKGDPKGALADYDKAIELQPNDALSFMGRGTVQTAAGNSAMAITDLNQAQSLLPANSPLQPVLFLSLGANELASGQNDRAIASWSKGIERFKPKESDPSILVSLYQGRAWAYAQAKNLAAAIGDINQLIERQPKNASAYYNRGSFYMQSQDPQRAILDFNQAITLQSDYAEAFQSRGLAHQALQDTGKSRADFQKAIELLTQSINKSPQRITTANTYVQRAVARMGMGDRPGAIQDVQAAKTLFEQNGIREGALYQSVQKMLSLLQPNQQQSSPTSPRQQQSPPPASSQKSPLLW